MKQKRPGEESWEYILRIRNRIKYPIELKTYIFLSFSIVSVYLLFQYL